MKLQVLPYVSVEIDDRLRRRARLAGERLRVTMRSYLLSAADDVDTAGDRVRGLCDRAVHRIDSVAATVTDKIDKNDPDSSGRPRLRIVDGREAG